MKKHYIALSVVAFVSGGCAGGGSGEAKLTELAGVLGQIAGSEIGGTQGKVIQAGARTVQQAGTQQKSLGFAGERASAREFDKKLRSKVKIIDDPISQTYLNGIVRKLSPHRSNARFPITARIINDPGFNAFTPGGGYLYLNSGLIAELENEAQLAMVIAHEIGHIDAGHIGGNRMSGVMAEGAGSLFKIGLDELGLGGFGRKAVETGGVLGIGAIQNTFSRGQETEADTIGFQTLVDAGYDAGEGAQTFAVMAKKRGSESTVTNRLFSSHPMSVERQRALSAAAAGRGDGVTGREQYLQNMGEILLLTADYKIERDELVAAKRIMERAYSANRRVPRVAYNLGRIAQKQRVDGANSLENAITYYREAISYDQSFAPAHRALGLAYLEQGDEQKAAASLRRFVQLSRNTSERNQAKEILERIEGRSL